MRENYLLEIDLLLIRSEEIASISYQTIKHCHLHLRDQRWRDTYVLQ